MPSNQLKPLLLTFLSLVSTLSVSAALVNVTIDDSQTDNGSPIIQYTSSLWNVGTDCGGCTAHPDSTRTLDGTWHDSTHEPGAGADGLPFASLQFDGTGIYVYCIVAHTETSPDGNSDMTFSIDGQTVGSFELAPTGQATYDYNVLVYANSSIPSGTHTFVLQNGQPGGAKSLVLLDYIVYTHDDGTSIPPPPPSSSLPTSPQSSTLATSSLTSQSSATSGSSGSSLSSPTQTSTSGPSVLPSSASSSEVVTSLSASFSTITPVVSSTVTTVQDSATTTIVSPSPSASGPSLAAAGASPHSSMSHKTRTIILAAAIPGGVLVLLVIVALAVCWRRRAKYKYHSPPERGINADPASSGWTTDAWVGTGSNSNHGHSNHDHDALPSLSHSDPLGRAGKAAEATVGRSRGFTVSSAVTAASSAHSISAYSRSSFGSGAPVRATADHPPLPGHSEAGSSGSLSYVTLPESTGRSKHPYAARTPEPYDSADGTTALSTVPEQSTSEHSPTASQENAPRSLPNPPVHVAGPQSGQATFVQGQSGTGRRPLPDRPALENQAQAARSRRVFRVPSVSSDLPPAYDDLSERGRESLPTSIPDTKL